jgi:hypothetical protein
LKDIKSAWERNPLYRVQSCKWEKIVEDELTGRLEREIHAKCGSHVNTDKYRDKVARAKANVYTLHNFPECTMLFLQKKIDASKVDVKNEKFRLTCLKLEEKMKKSEKVTNPKKLGQQSTGQK